MRLYACDCGSQLFFENTKCTACGRKCGWCEACQSITSLETANGICTCQQQGCGVALLECRNRQEFDVCNVFCSPGANGLCQYCRVTQEIPDLDAPGNLAGWQSLEVAKRRLLYDLDLVGFDWRSGRFSPPLRFRFVADTANQHYPTGHKDGLITINLTEASPVEREKARQKFSEPQRTLIGHMRHEVAHYLWQVLVQDIGEPAFVSQFGDHLDPGYGAALSSYYEQGAVANWPDFFISEYASSHPWEDFAETTAFYLDLRAVLHTVHWHFGDSAVSDPNKSDFSILLSAYQRLGIAFNEINRSMGLTDLLPEQVSPQVAKKIEFVHQLLL